MRPVLVRTDVGQRADRPGIAVYIGCHPHQGKGRVDGPRATPQVVVCQKRRRTRHLVSAVHASAIVQPIALEQGVFGPDSTAGGLGVANAHRMADDDVVIQHHIAVLPIYSHANAITSQILGDGVVSKLARAVGDGYPASPGTGVVAGDDIVGHGKEGASIDAHASTPAVVAVCRLVVHNGVAVQPGKGPLQVDSPTCAEIPPTTVVTSDNVPYDLQSPQITVNPAPCAPIEGKGGPVVGDPVILYDGQAARDGHTTAVPYAHGRGREVTRNHIVLNHHSSAVGVNPAARPEGAPGRAKVTQDLVVCNRHFAVVHKHATTTAVVVKACDVPFHSVPAYDRRGIKALEVHPATVTRPVGGSRVVEDGVVTDDGRDRWIAGDVNPASIIEQS